MGNPKRQSLIANRYLPLSELGAGGMGSVFLVKDTLEGTRKALKFLPKNVHESVHQTLKQEFAILTALKHPNLVGVFDFGHDSKKEKFFFTQEYVDGVDLLEATKDQPLSHLAVLVLQLTSAIEFIHRFGILHNDLKPSNILVAGEHLKLLDFGISSAASKPTTVGTAPYLRGTPGYLAPELVQGAAPTPASDFFSLGIILFRLFSGHSPYRSTTPDDLIREAGTTAIPHLGKKRTQVPKTIADVIFSLTRQNPGLRPKSLEQLVLALENITGKKHAALPSSKAPIHFASPLLGRELILDSTLTRIESHLHTTPTDLNVAHNAKPILAVIGAAGIGKSRFLTELGLRAQLKDFCVIHAPKTRAYGDLWQNLWGPILERLEIETQIAAPVFLKQRFDNQASPQASESSGDPGDESLRLNHALNTYLNQCTKIKKVLFIFDPLYEENQPFDAIQIVSTLNFLTRFSKGCFFLTSLSEKPTGLHAQLFDEDSVLLLPPLSLGETELFIASNLSHAILPKAFVKKVFAASQGIPGKIELTLKGLIQRGYIHGGKTGYVIDEDKKSAELPLQLDDVLQKDWKSLSYKQRQILKACSIFADDFSAQDVSIATGSPLPFVFDTIENGRRLGLFKSEIQGRFTWIQSIFRDKVLATFALTGKEKGIFFLWHRTYAHWLAGNPNPTLLDAEKIFYHFQKSQTNQETLRWALTLAHLAFRNRRLSHAEYYLQVLYDRRTELAAQDQFFVVKCQAQILAAQGRLKENETFLEHELKNPLWTEDQRFELLIQLSGHKRNLGKTQSSIDLSLSALKQTKAPHLTSRLLAQVALGFIGLGQSKEALFYIDQALVIGEKHLDQEGLGNLYNRKGLIHLSNPSEMPIAQKAFEKALELFTHARFTAGEALATHNLSLCAPHPKDKQALLEKALQFAQKAHDLKRIFHCLRSLGSLKTQTGEISKASIILKEALEYTLYLDDPERKIAIHYTLASLDMLKGNYVGAQKHLQPALTQARAENRPKEIVLGHLTLFQFYLRLGLSKEMDHLEPEIKKNLESFPNIPFQLFYERISLEKSMLFQNFNTPSTAPVLKLDDLDAIYLYLLHQDLSAEKNIENESHLSEINQALEALEGKTETIAWLETYGLWMLTALTLLPAKLILEHHSRLLNTYHDVIQDIPDLRLQMAHVAAQAFVRLKDAGAALHQIQVIDSIFEWQTAHLDVRWTDAFITHPRRRVIHSFSESVRHREDFLGHQINTLRNENSLLRDALNTLEMLFNQSSEQGAQKCVLDFFMKHARSTQGHFFLREKMSFRYLFGSDEQKNRATFISKTQHIIEKLNDQVFLSGNALIAHEELLLLPIYRQDNISTVSSSEKIPYGVFIFDGKSFPEANRLAEIFSDGFLRFFRERFLEKRLQSTTTEMSILRTTMTRPLLTQQMRYNYSGIIGTKSQPMKHLLYFLDKIIPTTISVLIQGESGTGKELIAQTIHAQGPLASQPMVAVNCGALAPTLIESILFGHVKGAFTGASDDHVGLIEQADGGTLFLDEIGELSLELQVKLLRVLEENEIRPVGGNEVKKVKFRCIAATHRNLPERIKQGLFREDLFYRLNGMTLDIPALRQRREDIPQLIEHFLDTAAKENDRSKKRFSAQALKTMVFFPWPGNIRQLKNTVELMTVLVPQRRIDYKDLPPEIRSSASTQTESKTFAAAKRDFTKLYLEHLLSQVGGNVTEAARRSGLRREYLHTLIKKEVKR